MRNKTWKEYGRLRRAAGICVSCAKPATRGTRRCDECTERYSKSHMSPEQRLRWAAYMREYSAKRRKSGICLSCKTESPNKAYCPPCAKFQSQKSTRKAQDKKLRAIALLGGKCVDCSGIFIGTPEVFDFDHIRDKKSNLRDLTRSASWARVEQELKNCELVCSNCHRIRTVKRTKS